MVSGRVDGAIEAQRLEIVASGRVTGNVTVGQLVIESGAHFNGVSKIRGEEPPRQLSHSRSEDAETANDTEPDTGTAKKSKAASGAAPAKSRAPEKTGSD